MWLTILDGVFMDDLESLRMLHERLEEMQRETAYVKSRVDAQLERTVWTGPAADKFQAAWDEFKPSFEKLQSAIHAGREHVRSQHTATAAAKSERLNAVHVSSSAQVKPLGPRSVATWLAQSEVSLNESVLVDALDELRAQHWLSDEPAPITEDEATFLSTNGGVEDDRSALVRSRVLASLRSDVIDRDSLSVEETAELLGVSASRVRHRMAEGTVYAFPARGTRRARRIPSWQFDGGTTIPHLPEVLAELPETFRPSEVVSFVRNAEIDAPEREEPIPLLTWLLDGGDPGPARALAAAQQTPV